MLFQFRVFLLFILYSGTNSLFAQILDINFSEVTNLEVEEFNYYSFRGESNHTLYQVLNWVATIMGARFLIMVHLDLMNIYFFLQLTFHLINGFSMII